MGCLLAKEREALAAAGLTAAEVECLEASAGLWNLLLALPVVNEMDQAEAARDLHNIQNRLLKRPAARALG